MSPNQNLGGSGRAIANFFHIDDLVQDCSNSIAKALELL